jgi:ATP-dependent helicase HrpA
VRAGHEVVGFPGLVDEGASVGLAVHASQDEQAAHHRLGVRRLLALSTRPPDLLGGLDNKTKLGLAGSPYGWVKELADDCVLAALGELVDLAEPVWDERSFAALLEQARRELPERSSAVLHQVSRVLGDWREVDRALHGRVDMAVLPSMNDMRQHLGRLVGRGFVADAGAAALRSYPRYLAALAERRRRIEESPSRDVELMSRVGEFQQGWEQRIAALPEGRPPGEGLVRLRWLIEEYRVSLWAQHLGTAVPVSDTRLRKLMNSL